MNKKMWIRMRIGIRVRMRVVGTRKRLRSRMRIELRLRSTRPGQVDYQSNKVEEMENMAEGGGAQG